MKNWTLLVALAALILTGCFGNPENSLIGTDSNQNGVRDSYEETINSSGLPVDVVDAALSAGKEYQKLVQLTERDEPISHEEAMDITLGIMLAKKCMMSKKSTSGVAWTESMYYDTIDRIKAKFSQGARLGQVIGNEDIIYPEGDNCTNLQNR